MNNKLLYGIIVVIIVIFVGFFMYKISNAPSQVKDEKQEENINQNTQNTESLPPVKEDVKNETATISPSAEKIDLTKPVMVEMQVKNFGKIKLELDGKTAPKTVENFVKLAQEGFYNGLTFHRIAKDFVIQGGDPDGTGAGGPGYTVPAEINLKHVKGAIAMARTGDQVNPKRESSGSQFYIALNELAQLDGQYTVFGKVIAGMDIVEKIGQVEINSPYGDGAPKEKVIIESVKVVK